MVATRGGQGEAVEQTTLCDGLLTSGSPGTVWSESSPAAALGQPERGPRHALPPRQRVPPLGVSVQRWDKRTHWCLDTGDRRRHADQRLRCQTLLPKAQWSIARVHSGTSPSAAYKVSSLRGRCACKRRRLEVADEFVVAYNCHCLGLILTNCSGDLSEQAVAEVVCSTLRLDSACCNHPASHLLGYG